MNKYVTRQKARRSRYWSETWRNKLCAIALIGIGLASVNIVSDATFAVVTFGFGVPMFFAKENWIM